MAELEDNSANSTNEEAILPPLCSIFRRFLKQRGLKFTAERAKILDAVMGKEGLFQAEELLWEMYQAEERVSKATIYRTIKHLVEAGIIQEVLIDSKQSHYQLIYGQKPIDYVVNVSSDEIIEFQDDAISDLCDAICRAKGLEPVGHRLLIFGVKPGEQPPE